MLTEEMVDQGAVAHHRLRLAEGLEPDYSEDPEWARPRHVEIVAGVPMYGSEAEWCRRISRGVLEAALEPKEADAQ